MSLNRARGWRFAPSMLAFATGLVVTAVLFAGARKLEDNHAEEEFREQASIRIALVKDGLLRTVEALTTLNHFFRTVGTVDREQFHTFATALLETNPQIRSFSFQRLLTPAQLPGYEAPLRKRYPEIPIGSWIDGQRVALGPMDSYRVVDFLETMQRNEVAFGLASSTIPTQFDAIQRARDTGLPSASEMLIGHREGQRSFAMMMAVYRRGAPLQDIGARRRDVMGFTTAIIGTGILVENALRDKHLLSDPTVDMSLYSGDSADQATLVYRTASAPAIQVANPSLWGWLYEHRPLKLSQNFSIAGKSWHMSVSAQSSRFGLRQGGSTMILIAGLGATFAGAAYLQTRRRHSLRRRQLGRRNDVKLQAAYELLNCDTGLRRQEEQARRLEERARQAGAHAVIITNASGPDHLIEQVDAAFERMTGYSAADAVGRNGNFLWGDDHDQPSIDEIRAAVDRTCPARITLRMYRRDGTLFLCGIHIFPVEAADGEAAYFAVALYDLTARAHYLKELEFQANRDAVTGLPNCNLLLDRLMQAIAHAIRNGEQLWVIAIDFDRTVQAGESGATRAGDMVWARAGERLQSLVRLTDTVACLAGGEFILVLAARSDEGLSPQVIRRLRDAIGQPLAVADRQVLPDCSAGIAVYPEDGDDGAALIANACHAMAESRKEGDDIRFYRPKTG